MPVDLEHLMQNVYDYFASLYSPGGTNTSGTFLAFERIGHPVSPAEFKLKADDPQFSPQVAEERFSAIVNSMLKASPEVFSDTPMKVDDFYSMLLLGSTPRAPDQATLQFFANLKAQAKKDFENALRNSMSLGGAQFHSTRASPSDWYDEGNPGNWAPYSFSTASPSSPVPSSLMMRPQASTEHPSWTMTPEAEIASDVLLSAPGIAATQVMLRRQLVDSAPTQNVSSSDFTVSFKYCLVRIDRAWIFDPFLQNRSWYLPGSKAGEYSTGQLENNSGEHRFPALPVAFIAIKDLQITANWSADDESRARNAIGLGGFSLAGSTFNSRTLSSPSIQILCWVCTVMPVLPPADDPSLAAPVGVGVPVSPGTAAEWQHVGHANRVVALAAAQGKLYCANNEDKLSVRDPVSSNIKWTFIGRAKKLTAMTGLGDKLYCTTRDNSLYTRTLEHSDIAWTRLGIANRVVGLAAVAGKLYCATREKHLWMRDPEPKDIHWTRIGQANDVVAMTATEDALIFATQDGKLWRREPGPSDVPWQPIGRTPAGAVTGLAIVDGKLWATTADNRLYTRSL